MAVEAPEIRGPFYKPSEPSIPKYPPFSGRDPEGDERIRQARNKEFQKERVLNEIRKVIEPELSPLEAIEKALKETKRRNHSPIKTDGPFVVLGIQPIFGEEEARQGSLASPVRKVVDRVLFVSGTFETEEEAERHSKQMAFNEFDINRSLIKGPDRNDLTNLTKFYSINIEELRKEGVKGSPDRTT